MVFLEFLFVLWVWCSMHVNVSQNAVVLIKFELLWKQVFPAISLLFESKGPVLATDMLTNHNMVFNI